MPKEVVRRYIELDADDVKWYEQHYPRGSLTGIIGMLFSKFREVSDMTAADYAKIAAESLAESLDKK